MRLQVLQRGGPRGPDHADAPVITLLLTVGPMGALYLMTSHLQQVHRVSPLQTARRLLGQLCGGFRQPVGSLRG